MCIRDSYNLDNLLDASDFEIDKIVKKPNKYSPEIQQFAQEIYESRNLEHYEKQIFIAKHPRIKKDVKKAIKENTPVSEQIDFLLKNGYTQIQAKNIISEVKVEIVEDEKKLEAIVNPDSGSGGWITTIFLILLLVRCVLRNI